jgi:hypothetical protein
MFENGRNWSFAQDLLEKREGKGASSRVQRHIGNDVSAFEKGAATRRAVGIARGSCGLGYALGEAASCSRMRFFCVVFF